MAYKLLSARKFTKELKVRIQTSGRLGFSAATQEELNIDSKTHFTFLYDDEAQPECRLAMVMQRTPSADAFPAIQSGSYYYLTTANLFDALKYDYKNESIYFTLKRDQSLDAELGGEVYVMHQRGAKGRSSKKEKTAESLEETLPFDEE